MDVDIGGVHGLSPGDGGLPQARLRLLQHLQRVPEPDQHPFAPQVRLHLHQFIALQRKSSRNVSDRTRHFSNWCDVYEEAEVVHGNWCDNHCNRSDTGPSMLLPELHQQPPCSLPCLEHTHTHTTTHAHSHTRTLLTHACACTHTHTHTHTYTLALLMFRTVSVSPNNACWTTHLEHSSQQHTHNLQCQYPEQCLSLNMALTKPRHAQLTESTPRTVPVRPFP